MSKNDPASGGCPARESFEFCHQVRVGEAVETVALQTLLSVAARDGEEFGYPRQVAMESSVETGDLRHAGIAASEVAYQRQFCGQMIRIKEADSAQLVQHRGIHLLRFAITWTAVNNPMADTHERRQVSSLFHQSRQPGNAS